MEIKTNYEKMTDQELDKLAAEMINRTKDCDYLISNDGGESLRISFPFLLGFKMGKDWDKLK